MKLTRKTLLKVVAKMVVSQGNRARLRLVMTSINTYFNVTEESQLKLIKNMADAGMIEIEKEPISEGSKGNYVYIKLTKRACDELRRYKEENNKRWEQIEKNRKESV